jgi:hypothetical protein
MAFEVDESDPATRTRWSVLFQGSATVIEDSARVDELHVRLPKPWVPSDSPMFWVHLRPDAVSGREIASAG